MKHEYILSVCMMVKNEEKNLKRCLDGLRPLLDKKDVELIIVDTGSTDQTAEIAREYTDKVYFHPWTDHFSNMRNITISYAKGSYILILDADEVLLDPLLLYEYINDIRLESYNTYSVKIKNYESSGGYTVVAQERVFKNDGEFCYKGSVHNQPVFKTPVLSTDIYVDHYGYLFYDRELRERKFKRTSTILLNELKKDPDNVYYRFQLARSYNAHHDMKEAEEEIEKAYQLISANKTQKSSMYVYGTHATILLSNRKWERGVKICSEGLEILPEYLDLYYMLAVALDKLGKRSEAQQAYEKYLDLVCRYDELDISANRAIEMFYTGPIFQDAALGFIISELYNQKKYHEAYEYSKRIHEEKARVIWQVKCLLKLGKPEELRDLYKQDHDRSVLETIVQLIENEMECSAIEDRKRIETVFSEGEDLYSLLNQIRISEGEERSRLVDKAIKEADFTRLPEYYAEMLTDIDIKTRQVLSVFKRMSKSGIKKYVAKMQNCKDKLESFFEEFLINEQVRENDFQSIKVYIGIAYAHLFIMASKLSKVKGKPSDIYYSIFKRYVDIGIKYTSILYNSQRLRLYYNTLEDQEDRFFIAMQYSMESIEKSDYKNGIRYFTEAARANPFMACYMDRYKDELFDEQSAVDIKEDDYE